MIYSPKSCHPPTAGAGRGRPEHSQNGGCWQQRDTTPGVAGREGRRVRMDVNVRDTGSVNYILIICSGVCMTCLFPFLIRVL